MLAPRFCCPRSPSTDGCAAVKPTKFQRLWAMNLTDLNVRELDKLLLRAQREQARRARRKSAADVRRMLQVEALRLGYELVEVFPEIQTLARPRQTAKALATDTRAPGTNALSGTLRGRSLPDGSADTPSPEPPRKHEPLAPVDVARKIVFALKSRDAFSAHLSVPLDALLQQVGMAEEWAAFHAGMEEANRRNWVHFRGNSHCVLTAEGDAVPAP